MAAKKRPDTIAQLRQRLDRARTPERRMAMQLPDRDRPESRLAPMDPSVPWRGASGDYFL